MEILLDASLASVFFVTEPPQSVAVYPSRGTPAVVDLLISETNLGIDNVASFLAEPRPRSGLAGWFGSEHGSVADVFENLTRMAVDQSPKSAIGFDSCLVLIAPSFDDALVRACRVGKIRGYWHVAAALSKGVATKTEFILSEMRAAGFEPERNWNSSSNFGFRNLKKCLFIGGLAHSSLSTALSTKEIFQRHPQLAQSADLEALQKLEIEQGAL